MGAIGKLLGTITHTCKVTNNKGESVQVRVKIDFTSATDDDIKAWVTGSRVIAGQRPWRALSAEELYGLNDQTFIAQNIGQKVKSRAEKLQVYTNAGMSEEQASFALDNPEKFKAIMDEVMMVEEVDDNEDE